APERGSQSRDAATARRAEDRPARLSADCESDQPAGCCRSWAGRGSAGPFAKIPRILGLPSEPAIPLRQLARSDFCQQDRPGVVQHLDDAGGFVDGLILISTRTPGGLKSLYRDDVLSAPGNSV